MASHRCSITVQVDGKLKQELVREAGRRTVQAGRRTSISDVIRTALEWYLDQQECADVPSRAATRY